MTTTIHISGLYTDPPSLILLASDSHHWACPQVSLLPCWLGFWQVGLVFIQRYTLFHLPYSGSLEYHFPTFSICFHTNYYKPSVLRSTKTTERSSRVRSLVAPRTIPCLALTFVSPSLRWTQCTAEHCTSPGVVWLRSLQSNLSLARKLSALPSSRATPVNR